MSMDAMRREYRGPPLTEDRVGMDPVAWFDHWFAEARQADPVTANSMTLATVDQEGLPDARIVLLKGVDEAGGFRFFSNGASAKGQQLAHAPVASLVLHWRELDRQVRIRGSVTELPREAVETYFASRPRTSQLAAACVRQGDELPDRQALLQAFADVQARLGEDPVPLPAEWTGYRLEAELIEFWQGQPSRLHDRLVFRRSAEGGWQRRRLAP